jgi:hypothetical protein
MRKTMVLWSLTASYDMYSLGVTGIELDCQVLVNSVASGHQLQRLSTRECTAPHCFRALSNWVDCAESRRGKKISHRLFAVVAVTALQVGPNSSSIDLQNIPAYILGCEHYLVSGISSLFPHAILAEMIICGLFPASISQLSGWWMQMQGSRN